MNGRSAADCASASIISTPGMTGLCGKWPLKNSSLTVTFLMAVMRLAQFDVQHPVDQQQRVAVWQVFLDLG